MGVYIRDMEKPKGCGVCEIWSLCHHPKVDDGLEERVMPDCPLIEMRDDYFKYYLETERLNDSRDILSHKGCAFCDVKWKCLYAFTPEAEECNHYGERRADD